VQELNCTVVVRVEVGLVARNCRRYLQVRNYVVLGQVIWPVQAPQGCVNHVMLPLTLLGFAKVTHSLLMVIPHFLRIFIAFNMLFDSLCVHPRVVGTGGCFGLIHLWFERIKVFFARFGILHLLNFLLFRTKPLLVSLCNTHSVLGRFRSCFSHQLGCKCRLHFCLALLLLGYHLSNLALVMLFIESVRNFSSLRRWPGGQRF
jgi:hypothetical protein